MARRQRPETLPDLYALMTERPHPRSIAAKIADAYGIDEPEADDALEDLFDDFTDCE